jgi:predicted Zn-dependent protease
MAGGKLLVGLAYVTGLELNDAELAMLLSHEIQHAVLEHNFREFQEALRIEPDRSTSSFADLEQAIDHDDRLMDKLAEFNRAQEMQADLEGLRMAWRAGWPASKLAGYYKKLARAERNTNSANRDHPSSMLRWQAVQQLTRELSGMEHHD